MPDEKQQQKDTKETGQSIAQSRAVGASHAEVQTPAQVVEPENPYHPRTQKQPPQSEGGSETLENEEEFQESSYYLG